MLIERLIGRMKLTPGLSGALLLATLGLIRALASADRSHVFVAGRVLHWECWLKQQFNFPCPTCGLTRGVLLALHGQVGAAWQLNPAAPLLVAGLTLLGLSLLFLALFQRRRTRLESGAWHRRIRIATKVYAHLIIAALFAHWITSLTLR